MCIVTVSIQENSNYPLIIVQNRDEVYERESLPIHFWEDHPDILAGRDVLRGGTWSGITKTGRFASMTNRPFDDFPSIKDSYSRGKLVKDYLSATDSPSDFLKYVKENRFKYDSYQIVFGTVDELYVYSNATDTHRQFKPGLHSVSNTSDDLSQHRIDRSLDLIGEYLKDHPEPNPDDLIHYFKDTQKAEELTHFPKEISYEMAKDNSSIFIDGETFGTVNTTVFLVHKSGYVTVKEVRYNTDGEIETTEKKLKLAHS